MPNISVSRSQGHCPFCKDPVQPHSQHQVCQLCLTRHHSDCWQMGGGCSVFGCNSKQALGAQSAPAGGRALNAPPVTTTPQQPRRGASMAVALAAVLMVGVSGAAFFVLQSSKPTTTVNSKTSQTPPARQPVPAPVPLPAPRMPTGPPLPLKSTKSSTLTIKTGQGNPAVVMAIPGMVIRHAAQIGRCSGKRSKRGSQITVTATLTVVSSGVVQSVGFKSTGGVDQPLFSCLERTIKRWRFPRYTGAATVVNIPLTIK